ncbi:MAG TPA: metallophosphoesterase [Gammaproteobacteria bacterium]|nr:metallophosphoesterase [Gammaproteobacteria bacterium]
MSSNVANHPRARRSRLRRALLAALAALAALPAATLRAEEPWRWAGVSRVVVVPDIHGAYDELIGLLQATAIIDGSLNWSGGAARLVSLGDLLDRGAESRKVVELLMRLQRDAPLHGGGVHVLLGNHEVMNLIGDVRYVSTAEYAAFAADEPEDARASAYERFRARPATLTEQEARRVFTERYPPGYFGHRLAFAPAGRYGSWLLSLPSLIVINDTAFVHGGLPGIVAGMSAGELNQLNQDDLRGYLAARDELAGAEIADDTPRATGDEEDFAVLNDARGLAVDGPLWYRGSVYCKAILEEPLLDAALERLDVAKVVVGHTPTEDRRVHELYEGKLIMLDTGMLASYYAGRPAALIIENGETLVQYLGPQERVRPERDGRLIAHGLTEPEIVEALATGEVLAVDANETGGRPELRLQYRGHTIQATFYLQDRARAADRELAAYRLDRLLDLDLVPPTVPRRILDQEGALQLSYPDAVSESARVERRLGLGTWCPVNPQLQLMYAFDALIHNTGRTRDSVFFRLEIPDLKLVGHQRAFGAERGLREGIGELTPTPALVEALTALNEERLEATLGTWLSGAQIRALLARRDALLERFAQHD